MATNDINMYCIPVLEVLSSTLIIYQHHEILQHISILNAGIGFCCRKKIDTSGILHSLAEMLYRKQHHINDIVGHVGELGVPQNFLTAENLVAMLTKKKYV